MKEKSLSNVTCDVYSSRNGLNNHILSIHQMKRYKCTKCDACFTQEQGLKGHIGVVHEEKNNIVQSVVLNSHKNLICCSSRRKNVSQTRHTDAKI